MTRRSKRAPLSRASPGGPGAMEALRRAQAKLKEMGIKLYKWEPPTRAAPKGDPPPAPKAETPKPKPLAVEPKAASKPAPAKRAVPKRVATKRAPAAAKRAKARVRR